jgi:hypothetical protein
MNARHRLSGTVGAQGHQLSRKKRLHAFGAGGEPGIVVCISYGQAINPFKKDQLSFYLDSLVFYPK